MAIEILTAALVLITAYYAWQNRAMVREMRQARGVPLLPKVVPTLRLLGAGHCLPRITNIGPGAATDVDVNVGFAPGGPVRRWISPIVVPGEIHDFYIQEESQTPDLTIADQLITKYSQLTLQGSYKNVIGESFTVDETVDIKELWELAKSSQHLQPQEDPLAKRMKELHGELKGIHKALERMVRALERQVEEPNE